MKKLFLLVALVFSSFAIQAQSLSLELNAGTLTHDSFGVGGIVNAGDDLTIGHGSLGASLDFFNNKMFNFGPVAKLYAYEKDYFGGNNPDLNHYNFSGGLNAGVTLGKFSLDTSFEVPLPGKRESIFEAIISPSASFMISDHIGIKANYDYFINKKLFNYASSISGGLIYKF